MREGEIAASPLAILSLGSVSAAAWEWWPAWPELSHSVALPSLGLAHDLAALLVRTSGGPAFAGGAILSLLVRSALAAMTGGLSKANMRRAALFQFAAWPGAFLASGYAAGARFSRFGGTSAFEVDSPLGQVWLGNPSGVERRRWLAGRDRLISGWGEFPASSTCRCCPHHRTSTASSTPARWPSAVRETH